MSSTSIPASAFDESVFEDGLAFDGSSVRGFQSIHESDMMLLPDPETARIDPFRAAKTLNLNFFVHDPFTREAYSRDPRNVARKAENYLTSTGIADTAYFGAEAEFYIFDSVSFDSKINGTFYEVDSSRAGGTPVNRSRPTAAPTAATRSAHQAAFPGRRRTTTTSTCATRWPPTCRTPASHWNAVTTRWAPPGRPRSTTSSTRCCTRPTMCCCSVHHQEHRLGQLRQDGHLHARRCSVTTVPVCTRTSRCGRTASRCSTTSRGTRACRMSRGITSAASCTTPSLLAFTNPTVNSYKRLVPGYEARSTWCTASATARPACVSRSPATTRRPSAWSSAARTARATPTLAFAAMLMAGIDGIKNKIEPLAPVDKDLYELPPDEAANIPQAPTSLAAVIDKLEEDHDYLTEGGVFTGT